MITQEGSNCKLVRSVKSGNVRCFLGQLLKQISFKGRKSRVKGNQDWKNTAEPKTCRSKDQSTATSVSPPREVIRQGMGRGPSHQSHHVQPCLTVATTEKRWPQTYSYVQSLMLDISGQCKSIPLMKPRKQAKKKLGIDAMFLTGYIVQCGIHQPHMAVKP